MKSYPHGKTIWHCLLASAENEGFTWCNTRRNSCVSHVSKTVHISTGYLVTSLAVICLQLPTTCRYLNGDCLSEHTSFGPQSHYVWTAMESPELRSCCTIVMKYMKYITIYITNYLSITCLLSMNQYVPIFSYYELFTIISLSRWQVDSPSGHSVTVVNHGKSEDFPMGFRQG